MKRPNNHDIAGIMRHIDRNTGKLTRCFMPRCASRITPAAKEVRA